MMRQALETGALGQLENLHSNEFFFVVSFCLVNYCFRGNWQELRGCPAITESYSLSSELIKIGFLQPCIYL